MYLRHLEVVEQPTCTLNRPMLTVRGVRDVATVDSACFRSGTLVTESPRHWDTSLAI